MLRIAASVGILALIAFSIAFNTSRYPKVWDVANGPSHSLQPANSTQPGDSADPSRASRSGYGAAATPSTIPPNARGTPPTLPPKDVASGRVDKGGYPSSDEKTALEKDRLALSRETSYGQSPGTPGDKESAADAHSAPRPIEQDPSLREPQPIASAKGLPSYEDSYAMAAKPLREAPLASKYAADLSRPAESSTPGDLQTGGGPQASDRSQADDGESLGPSLSAASAAPARRMVPVVYPGSKQGAAEKSTSSSRNVLRLPPTDRLGSGPAESTPPLPMDPIPIYPSTGVE